MTFPAEAPTWTPVAVAAEPPFRSSTVAASPEAGATETRRLADEGLIRHVVADVFVARDVPDSLHLRASAAGLLIPCRRRREQSWVVAGASAAWVYLGWRGLIPDPTGLLDLPPGSPPGPARLDVLVTTGRHRPPDPWVRARQAHLEGADIVLLHGLPVTDPVRTAADVARELPQEVAVRVLVQLGELAQVSPPQVLHRLTGMRYARGAARARGVVAAWQHHG